MKDEILNSLNDPHQLEKLYRSNRTFFKREFAVLYPTVKDKPIADFWNERLNYEKENFTLGNRNELLFVIIASLVAGFIAKLPLLFHWNEEFFYSRNIGFIVFPALSAYFAYKNKLSILNSVLLVIAILAGLVFINLLPDVKRSDSIILSCAHLVLFLWCILGLSFTGRGGYNEKRLDFLKYNGDLVVITTLILIAGGILTGITIGLFSVSRINIEKFYFENVVVFGLAAAPIVGTYLTQSNPQLVGKVSPVIAKIFCPLVLVMLAAYLVTITFSSKNPYNDRDFLLIFNLLLIGVMAIIFFSVAETSKNTRSTAEIWILFLLSALTIVVNGIALSAILIRISDWGFTPNRTAVLGGNVLILINLLLVTVKLFRSLHNKSNLDKVGSAIGSYLPVYFVWTIIVTFIFPLIFHFK